MEQRERAVEEWMDKTAAEMKRVWKVEMEGRLKERRRAVEECIGVTTEGKEGNLESGMRKKI